VAFIFVSAENATEDKSTVVIHVGLKVIDDFIGRLKNDIEAKKRENNNTGKRKNEDDGKYGNKAARTTMSKEDR
jgi:hypothetical protein